MTLNGIKFRIVEGMRQGLAGAIRGDTLTGLGCVQKLVREAKPGDVLFVNPKDYGALKDAARVRCTELPKTGSFV